MAFRLHGMKDDHWLINDKISQLRGLINLQTRDRKKQICACTSLRRSQLRGIHALKLECKRDRVTLGNSMHGDKQKLRTILQHHRAIQLAYRDSIRPTVADHLDVNNFVKIKELDRLRYQKKQRMQVFANLRYELSNLSHAVVLNSSTLARRRNLLNQTQRMSVMRNTAENIREIYQSILILLKKDSMYFDTVLDCLRRDVHIQCRCVIRATELGQMATEDLANIRDDIIVLEEQLKLSMRERDHSVKEVKRQVQQLSLNCKMLVRAEDDEHLHEANAVSMTDIGLALLQTELEKVMQVVADVTVVSTFDDIFPRMEDQIRQRNRLLHQMNIGTEMRDALLNMRNHAELMLATLQHAMVDITFKYKEDKHEILQEYKEVTARMRYEEDKFEEQGNLLCTLRSALQTLFEMLTRVDEPGAVEEESDHDFTDIQEGNMLYTIPPPFEQDAIRLLKLLSKPLLTLIRYAKEGENAEMSSEVTRMYQEKIIELLSQAELEDQDTFDYPLIEENEVEDVGVLSRLEVKQRSQKIVAHFEKTDLDPIGPIQRIGRKKPQHKFKKA